MKAQNDWRDVGRAVQCISILQTFLDLLHF